jgi:hypothetical protein
MIPAGADDITAAVLAAADRTPDPRQRELLLARVRHLHARQLCTRVGVSTFGPGRRCGLVSAAGTPGSDSGSTKPPCGISGVIRQTRPRAIGLLASLMTMVEKMWPLWRTLCANPLHRRATTIA